MIYIYITHIFFSFISLQATGLTAAPVLAQPQQGIK